MSPASEGRQDAYQLSAHSCWLFFDEIKRHHCHFQTSGFSERSEPFLTDSVFWYGYDSLAPLPVGDGEVNRPGAFLRNN